MFDISVEKTKDSIFEIKPMSVKRDWMDHTTSKHAYRCFPVTQANVVGFSLSCIEDIIFTWDGMNDETADHIQITRPLGAYGGRGQSSISFDTGLVFRTDNDVSLWTINPVNYFNDDFETMSNFISTSFYNQPLPLAIKAKKSNVEVTIEKGTPIATIIPISLTNLNNTSITIVDYSDPQRKREESNMKYGAAAGQLNKIGKYTDWYRDAVNEKNESLGSHEVKALKLHVIDKRKKM
ncbi:MAG: hypothetical protein FJX80_05255 [Bacteroidetes bacterium]|nr:hypothetical protein [Bacteroidota bacterium]